MHWADTRSAVFSDKEVERRFERLFADAGRLPFLRLNRGDALLKKKNNGGGESETLGTLAIAFDDMVTEGFALRGAQNCSHV